MVLTNVSEEAWKAIPLENKTAERPVIPLAEFQRVAKKVVASVLPRMEVARSREIAKTETEFDPVIARFDGRPPPTKPREAKETRAEPVRAWISKPQDMRNSDTLDHPSEILLLVLLDDRQIVELEGVDLICITKLPSKRMIIPERVTLLAPETGIFVSAEKRAGALTEKAPDKLCTTKGRDTETEQGRKKKQFDFRMREVSETHLLESGWLGRIDPTDESVKNFDSTVTLTPPVGFVLLFTVAVGSENRTTPGYKKVDFCCAKVAPTEKRVKVSSVVGPLAMIAVPETQFEVDVLLALRETGGLWFAGQPESNKVMLRDPEGGEGDTEPRKNNPTSKEITNQRVSFAFRKVKNVEGVPFQCIPKKLFTETVL